MEIVVFPLPPLISSPSHHHPLSFSFRIIYPKVESSLFVNELVYSESNEEKKNE